MNVVIEQRPERLPFATACRALGLNRGSVYARSKRSAQGEDQAEHCKRRSRVSALQPRALSAQERQVVIDIMQSDEHVDQPPAQVYHKLLQEKQYYCSIRTMHRIMGSLGQNGERRNQRPAQQHPQPRLLATRPNEVWTWDITKLPLTRRGVYLSLYVVLDLFSRFVLAWMVSRKENSALATQLIEQAHARYGIQPGELTLHQDRGSPMIAHGYLDVMKELSITCSHSRPRVSNDNAFSESQFKTQKYQPDYPDRFNSVAHASQWCEEYFDWYNFSHHHSGLAGFTPEQVFTARYLDVAKQKQQALDAMYERYPERFVKGRPHVVMPPLSVAINPVVPDENGNVVEERVNFPTLAAAGYQKVC